MMAAGIEKQKGTQGGKDTGSSSGPFNVSEIGITKSGEDLTESVPPLLPDDENVSST